jgi:hypothetical protein
MVIICDGYPRVQVSKDDFEKIQWVVGGLVGGIPEEGSPPSESIPTGQKGLPLCCV